MSKSNARNTRKRTDVPAAPVTPANPTAEPSVTLRVQIDTNLTIPVGDGETVKIDVTKLRDNPEALKHVVLYGIGRFTRDGTTKIREGEGKDAKLRDATPKERKDLSEAKWTRLFEGRMRERSVGSSDPVLHEARTLAVRFLVKSGVAKKDVPKLGDRDAIKAALAAHAGIFDKIMARAAKLAEMKDADF